MEKLEKDKEKNAEKTKLKEILKRSLPENFQIKVTVLECRQLTLGTEDVASPYVVVQVADQMRVTAVLKEAPDAIFNESFSFQIVSTHSELKTLKILIKVMHKTRWYRSDVEIGSVSVDAFTVYSKNTKMINKAWATIEKERSGEAGHINYSILVIGESDKLLALRGDMDDEEEQQQEGDDEANKKKTFLRELVQGAPPIEKRSYLLQVNIYAGEFYLIPGHKELNSKVRVVVSQGGVTETALISNSWSPAWKEQFNIPMRSPFYISSILVEVWHGDTGEKLLGRFVLDFNQLTKDGQLETKWSMIYGPEREDSFVKKMKYKYRVGSEVEPHYCYGRVLTSAKWVQDDHPIKINYPSPEAIIPDRKQYVIWFDVYELSAKELSHSDEIYVELQVGAELVTGNGPATYNKELDKFYWRNEKEIRNKERIILLPYDSSQLPDLFMRVKKKVGIFSPSKEDIAYCRFKAEDLLENKGNVKAKWQKLRKVTTQVKADTDENYLGLLLCSVNFFRKPDRDLPRPIVIETRNFKKYKLISVIYMANNVPVLSKGILPTPRVEITFNGKTRCTEYLEKMINPVFGEILFISTYLNDCLDLCENIKMSVVNKGKFSSDVVGGSEIEVGKIRKYNSQNYIEKDIYKDAKWYSLFEGTRELDAKVLATFMIVKLTKQGREDITLHKTHQTWPKQEDYRLYIFIVGVRKIPTSVDLNNAYVICKIHNTELEKESDKNNLSNEEKFTKPQSLTHYDNNLNVNDEIKDQNLTFKRHSVYNKKEFVYPMGVFINKDGENMLSTNVDLCKYITDMTIKGQSPHKKKKETKQKKQVVLNPLPEDFIPIYKREVSEMDKTKENSERYLKNVSNFPFEQEEANTFLGKEVSIHIYRTEYDKKGKEKKDDLSHNRPDIDQEYENELDDAEFEISTSQLQMSGGAGDNFGVLRYLLKVVKEGKDDDNQAEIKRQEAAFLRTKEMVLFYSKHNEFVCRIYILNTSNLHVEDNTVEQAFVWIKRWEEDKEWADDKKPFQISCGEVNTCYSLQVNYPHTFFLRVSFHAIKKFAGVYTTSEEIGSTEIDLEKRFFHKGYSEKLKDFKTFKQIPVESRTLYHGKEVRGAVRLWVEILPKSRELELLPERLVAQTAERYELRLVVWNTRDLPVVEGGKLDIFVRVTFPDGEADVEQETDAHCGSKDGHGKFNWRVVVPFRYPNNKTSVTVSVYDWNKVASNDLLCSNVINIKRYLNKIHRTRAAVDFPRDWLPMKLSSFSAARGNFETGGEVELEFKLLTFNEAQSNLVGRGRDEPNKDPFLEMPKEGRSWMDKLTFIGDILSGIGGVYDGIFKWLKIFGVIFSVAILAYILSILTKL